MQIFPMKSVATVLLLVKIAVAAHGKLRAGRAWTRLANTDHEETRAVDHQGSEQGLVETLHSMMGDFVRGRGAPLKNIADAIHQKIDLNDAVKRLDGKLPSDVASLVKLTAAGKKRGDLDEASLEKGRKYLNKMMYEAWGELDKLTIECIEFHERNQNNLKQVLTDIQTLSSNLAKLEGEKSTARSGRDADGEQIRNTDITINTEDREFKATNAEQTQDLQIKKNDLAVFDLIMKLTECKDGSALVQLGTPQPPRPRICNTTNGLELHFADRHLQRKLDRMMTPRTKRMLGNILTTVSQRASFQQLDEETTTTTGLPTYAAETVPVTEEANPDGQWKKCVDGEPNCGLLHDLMSLEWGKFKDQVDELTDEMEETQALYDATKGKLNDGKSITIGHQSVMVEDLSVATGAIDTDTLEMGNKQGQKQVLEEEYEEKCKIFQAMMSEILFTKICAVRRVRNELMMQSSVSPPDQISDCDFSDWASKNGNCIGLKGPIFCDDGCPAPGNVEDPYACGGIEVMKRDVLVAPNEFGMACPAMETKKKCRQHRCPVNCLMSKWSSWSKCTKVCGNGVEVKTRDILVTPKNGGDKCESTQEVRDCNTGSCDRNCMLSKWTEWGPCSMACGGGTQERRKKVLIPVRANGKCPRDDSELRYEIQHCNTQACVGDEICVAHQDLIIALDSSGSMTESGWKIVKEFAVELTNKYETEAYNYEAMKVGVVLFGNGRLIEGEGGYIVSPALRTQDLTKDLAALRAKIEEQTWQRGFTNMAQAFSMAYKMLTSASARADSQSAVLMMSDGLPSFRYQTEQKATQLKDNNVMIFMAPITKAAGSELEDMKKWASQPWETNYEKIDGTTALEFSKEAFATALLVKFCPDALSMSTALKKDDQIGYMLIKEYGWPNGPCAGTATVDHGRVENVDACAEASRKINHNAFTINVRHFMQMGQCYSYELTLEEGYWATYLPNIENPPCPGGGWDPSYYFDTYLLNVESV
mmetsp:Transcript_45339/g.140079  ORF Transcript_45339/g.140079 Transcript_45339/m.140079 type:complete len:988 (-) Transcript_45339:95-3058(-)